MAGRTRSASITTEAPEPATRKPRAIRQPRTPGRLFSAHRERTNRLRFDRTEPQLVPTGAATTWIIRVRKGPAARAAGRRRSPLLLGSARCPSKGALPNMPVDTEAAEPSAPAAVVAARTLHRVGDEDSSDMLVVLGFKGMSGRGEVSRRRPVLPVISTYEARAAQMSNRGRATARHTATTPHYLVTWIVSAGAGDSYIDMTAACQGSIAVCANGAHQYVTFFTENHNDHERSRLVRPFKSLMSQRCYRWGSALLPPPACLERRLRRLPKPLMAKMMEHMA